MNKTLLKIVVLSVSLLPMSVTAVSSVLADISMAFPEASPNTIMLIISLPALLMIPFTLLCGKLSSFMSKKILVSLGLILFLIGGVGPAFVNNLNVILVFRAILGIGNGFIMTLAAGLIADFYEDVERAVMMGWQSAVINIGAIISSLIAGFLGIIDWHYAFLIYFGTLGVLLLILLKLPETKIESKISEKTSLGWSIYGVSFLTLLYSILIFTFFTNIALVITGENLGNAASAGIVITTMTVGGLIAGLFFGKMVQMLKQFTVIVSVGLTGIGFLMLSHPSGYNFILVGSLIIGLGFGSTMPWIMIKVAGLAPKNATIFALSIVTSAISLGQFLTPIVFTFIGNIAGDVTGRFAFFISGAGILMGSLLLLLMVLGPPKKVTVQN